MKNKLLLFIMILLPMVANAQDIEVQNADGVTIYYNYINDGTELAVTYRGNSSTDYSNEYQGKVVIPEEVTYMNITRKVTSIGDYAFCKNSGLTYVTIPNSVTSIGFGAFFECSGLTSITIPNSVTSIGGSAFGSCSGLTSITIPNNVTSIGGSAFGGCSGLTSITIPKNVTSIGENAFCDCSSLTKVTINSNAILSIEYSYLFSFKNIFGTQVQEYILGNEVKSIGNYAFYECSGITSITIPNSVTSIGGNAFYGCSGLTSITIPNSVTSIGDYAFYKCSGITSIIIPNSVTSIGGNAFDKCTGLVSVTIPNSVTSIGEYTFYQCSNLISVTIPNSVTSIGYCAFMFCSGLTSVTIPNSVTSIGENAFRNCSNLPSVTIPNSVTSIGDYAFYNCSNLTSVTIPNSVTSIGTFAFYECSGLFSAIIGEGVTSIGYNAFSSANLKKVIWLTDTPPSGCENASGAVNYVSNDNFTSLSNKIVYPLLNYYFDVDGIRYIPVSASERTCDAIDCVYNSTANTIVIASTVSYKDVSMSVKNIQPYFANNNIYIENLNVNIDGKISEYAFTGCSNMSTATLGEKVTEINQDAFQGCSKLQSIVIPNSVKSIGNNVFQNCSALEYVQIGKGIGAINDYAFSGCSALPKITIPGSVSSISNYAFSGCESLKEVIMEDSESELKLGSNDSSPLFSDSKLDSVYIGRNISYGTSLSYGYSPFYCNTSLRAVKITDEETEISANEFYGCTNLQRVIIGDGVTIIDDYAFSGSQSLKFFTFGSHVKRIGEEAFSGCMSVVEIVSKAQTPPTCGTQALDDINKWNCKLFVPKGCISAYQATDQWKDFFIIEEGGGSGGDDPGEAETPKCEKPTISYTNGQLSFASDTEGVKFVTEITDSDIKRHYDAMIQLSATYTISVYATKSGYEDSETATATLCWIDAAPRTEGISDGIANIPANAVLIQSEGGAIHVQGLDDGTQVNVYSFNGTQAGSAISQNGAATINTNLQPSSIAIIKIGQKSVKVVIK